MTGMFALFLVLWLVNQSSDVKSAIAGYFNDPLGRASEYGSAIIPGQGSRASTSKPMDQSDVIDLRRTSMDNLAKDIRKKMAASPELVDVAKNVEITVTEEGLRIELLEDSTGVFFDTGRPSPSQQGDKVLSILGVELGLLPFPVCIEGHTDAYPYRESTSYTNWELSADRANAARRIMVESGLRMSQISSVTGLADRQPRLGDNPFDASNRRITITVLTRPQATADGIRGRQGGAGVGARS
jgi:chemotaxis protein MotB